MLLPKGSCFLKSYPYSVESLLSLSNLIFRQVKDQGDIERTVTRNSSLYLYEYSVLPIHTEYVLCYMKYGVPEAVSFLVIGNRC